MFREHAHPRIVRGFMCTNAVLVNTETCVLDLKYPLQSAVVVAVYSRKIASTRRGRGALHRRILIVDEESTVGKTHTFGIFVVPMKCVAPLICVEICRETAGAATTDHEIRCVRETSMFEKIGRDGAKDMTSAPMKFDAIDNRG